MQDRRRLVPATDRVLAEPEVADAVNRWGRERVKRAVRSAQQHVRDGELAPDEVPSSALAELDGSSASVRRVLNATGVLLHTNLGRAPLSEPAVRALSEAAGTTDVELDLPSGQRGPRGAATTNALLEAVPEAEAAHVVNNGAAALALTATALARGGEIVLARGEMVEIGAGFRIPELLAATGARLREVGTTNRVHHRDYEQAIGPETGLVLKVHPSNFVISGFTSSVPVDALADLPAPLVVDIGSGLLRAHPALPSEPDARTALADGADLVTASGDKLLGGPQAGLLLGRRDLVDRVRSHPLARAVRVDKLTLAGLEATIRDQRTPTSRALDQDGAQLLARAERLAGALRESDVDAEARNCSATVGGGGAPGVELASAGVVLPERFAKALRTGEPPVLARLEHGQCLLDLHAVAPEDDRELLSAVVAAR